METTTSSAHRYTTYMHDKKLYTYNNIHTSIIDCRYIFAECKVIFA